MEFIVKEDNEDKDFSLIYDQEGYSFDREPCHEEGFTSIMINDLQLEIDAEGKVLYVWGYCPLTIHDETRVFPRTYKTASLFALTDKPPVPGISYRLNEAGRWPIHINKTKKWVCIGSPETEKKELVKFSPDCVATMEDNRILAIWLHPKNFPNISN